MNQKITFPELVNAIAESTGYSKHLSEEFLKELFALITNSLASGENVKIKKLGTFKVVDVEARKSVKVGTGEEIEIPGHKKVTFTPDKELAEAINLPFAAFETIELKDSVTDEMLESTDCETELPDKPANERPNEVKPPLPLTEWDEEDETESNTVDTQDETDPQPKEIAESIDEEDANFDSLQDYNDIEYILVDGASTDATLDIIKSYEEKFGGRLKYVSEPDKGLYDAMNKGILMATGDVVGILNSDDFLNDTGVISMVVKYMKDTAVDAIYGDVHYVNDNNLAKCVRYYSSKIFSPKLMRLGFMPAHPSFYCRTKVYREKGVFDLNFKQAADFELLLRLIYCERIKTQYIPYDFVTMRTGGLSSSGIKSHKAIMKDHCRALRHNHVRSNVFLLSLRYVYKVIELIATKFIKPAPMPNYVGKS